MSCAHFNSILICLSHILGFPGQLRVMRIWRLDWNPERHSAHLPATLLPGKQWMRWDPIKEHTLRATWVSQASFRNSNVIYFCTGLGFPQHPSRLSILANTISLCFTDNFLYNLNSSSGRSFVLVKWMLIYSGLGTWSFLSCNSARFCFRQIAIWVTMCATTYN